MPEFRLQWTIIYMATIFTLVSMMCSRNWLLKQFHLLSIDCFLEIDVLSWAISLAHLWKYISTFLFHCYYLSLCQNLVSTKCQAHNYVLDIKTNKKWSGPDLCSSVGWVLYCKAKCHLFNSQSGHMPGLQAQSPQLGVCERQSMDVSPTCWCSSPFLPRFPSL